MQSLKPYEAARASKYYEYTGKITPFPGKVTAACGGGSLLRFVRSSRTLKVL